MFSVRFGLHHVSTHLLSHAWQQNSQKHASTQDRISAPLKSKHKPEAFNELWKLLAPAGDTVACESTNPELQNVQRAYFFAGSGTMKTCNFEPDALGSLRVFTTGKIRMQFFKWQDVKDLVGVKDLVTNLAKDSSYQEALEDGLKNLVISSFEVLRGKSSRCLVDCGSGPQALVVPPCWIVVQEALDGIPSCGVRRSFTPRGERFVDAFESVAAKEFAYRNSVISAMKS